MADTYEPGQSVTIHDHYRGPVKITTVEKVTNGGKRVVTSDGKEWKMPFGLPWGNKDRWYTGPTIRPFQDGDLEAMERKRLVAGIMKFSEWVSSHGHVNKDMPVTTEALRSVVAAMDAARQSAANTEEGSNG